MCSSYYSFTHCWNRRWLNMLCVLLCSQCVCGNRLCMDSLELRFCSFRIQSVALCMASSMWATWVISILYAGWAEARVQQWAQPPSWGAQWSGVVPDSSLPCPQPGTGKMYTTQVCIVYMYRHIGCTVKWVPYCSMSIPILMGEMRERLSEVSGDSFSMYHVPAD